MGSGKIHQAREERRARLAALPALTREQTIETLRAIITEIEDTPLPVDPVYFDHYQSAKAAIRLLTEPPADLNTATLGITSVADFSAIIIRQEREKQELLGQLAMLERRVERAETERNALGLSLSGFGAALQRRIHGFDQGRPWSFATLPDVLNVLVSDLYQLASGACAAPKAARDLAYTTAPVPNGIEGAGK